MVSRAFHSLPAIVAFIVMIAASAMVTPQAQAQVQCCGFGIGNNSSCTFRVTLVTAAGETVFPVPPGGGSWTIPDCADFRLKVQDACGNEIYLPNVIGECVRVNFGPGCCVRICKISACRWQADPIHCPDCP